MSQGEMSGCLEKNEDSNWPIKKEQNKQTNNDLENQDENNLKNNSEWTENVFVTFPHYLSDLEIKSHKKSICSVLN